MEKHFNYSINKRKRKFNGVNKVKIAVNVLKEKLTLLELVDKFYLHTQPDNGVEKTTIIKLGEVI